MGLNIKELRLKSKEELSVLLRDVVKQITSIGINYNPMSSTISPKVACRELKKFRSRILTVENENYKEKV